MPRILRVGLNEENDNRKSKNEKRIPTVRWNSRQSGSFWDTKGPKDAFKAHPLALYSIAYKSSVK